MTRALHAEWTKLRTLPACGWLAFAIVVLTLAASVAATATVDTAQCRTPGTCFEDTTKLSLGGIRLGQVAAVALAVLAVGSEYASGTIAATLAATPRRRTVLLAKAAVVAVVVLAAGALGVLGSLAAGSAILPANGFGGDVPSLADGATLRAAAGSVLYLVLVALLAFGVGTAVRDGAVAITAVLGLLYVAPIGTGLVSDPRWQDWWERLAPMPAGLAVQATRRLDQLPIGPWPGLGVLAAWAALALAAGGWLFVARDA